VRLRFRSALSFAVTMVAFMALEIPAAILIASWRGEHLRVTATERFGRIEAADIAAHLSRVRSLLDLKSDELATFTRDHASWTEMRDFATGRLPGLREAVFGAMPLRTANIDIAALYDSRGRRLLAVKVPADPRTPLESGAAAADALIGPGGPLANPGREGARAMVWLDGTLVIASAFPVLTTSGDGAFAGTLLFARREDENAIRMDSVRAGVAFQILPSNDAPIPADQVAAMQKGGAGATYIPPAYLALARGTQEILPVRGYGVLATANDDVVRVLEVIVPPDLMVEQRTLINGQLQEYAIYTAIYLGGVAFTNAVLFAILFLMLNRFVLARVFRISQGAMRIAQDPESSGSIPEEGDDELTRIGASFNQVLRFLRQRQEDLRAANRRVRAVTQEIAISHEALNASLLPVVITDADGRITRVNEAFHRVFGYTVEEAKGRRSNLLNPGRAEYLDHGVDDAGFDRLFRTLWADVLDPAKGTWEGTLYNRHKDGAVIPMQVVINAIRSEADGRLGFVAWMIDLSRRQEAEERTRIEVYRALSELAEARDSDTGAHLRRIALLSRHLAKVSGWGPRMQREIEIFAPLHDVGKVGISDAVLLLPGRLSPEQFEIMKTHASIGWSILKDRPTMEMAAEIAGGHHEKWDGSGYPRGLKGEEIPLSARIVAVVDVYDALRSDRPYKKAWSAADARAEIGRLAATHLDPGLVSLFLEHAGEFEEIFQGLELVAAPA
jgi:HD-GYP domain-containing protein (c-di-GMP phosphodiesterase class II)/sensor domain CHASE-containing protein